VRGAKTIKWFRDILPNMVILKSRCWITIKDTFKKFGLFR